MICKQFVGYIFKRAYLFVHSEMALNIAILA